MTTFNSEPESAEALRQEISVQRDALGRDLEALGDHMSPGRMVERRRAAVRQRVRGVSDRLMGTAESAGNRLGSAGERLGAAPDAARETVQGNPLAMGLISFGVGLVAASVAPSTRTERDLAARAEPALERAAEAAGSIARDEVEQLKPEVRASVEQVKEDAREAAQEVKGHAQGAAQEVREQQRPSV